MIIPVEEEILHHINATTTTTNNNNNNNKSISNQHKQRATNSNASSLTAASYLPTAGSPADKVLGCNPLQYAGIDTSMNPSLDENESIVLAYESILGGGKFGSVGTLAISSLITRVMKSIDIQKKVGYCGLMLPVMEDKLLAHRAVEKKYSIQDLVMWSSVCGVGCDTVPVSLFTLPTTSLENTINPRTSKKQESKQDEYINTSTTEMTVAISTTTNSTSISARGKDSTKKNHVFDFDSTKSQRLYSDLAALAFKLDKPLSCRLLPLPKHEGEMTSGLLDSPYLTDTKIFSI
jgi:uncharacterized protein (UPF0210 family)